MGHLRLRLEQVQFVLVALGCGFLFWQHDAAATDWFFAGAIALSVPLWLWSARRLRLEPPILLLVLFIGVSVSVTVVAGGSLRFLAITLYLALSALSIASVVRADPGRRSVLEVVLLLAGVVTAALVTAGFWWEELGLPALQGLAQGVRGRGLFKDSNVAGAFVACAYPLAAAFALRAPRFRILVVVLVTGIFGAGALFSLSRMAVVLFILGIVGLLTVLVLQRRWIVAICLLLAASLGAVGVLGFAELPLHRFRPIQIQDESARFVAWLFAVEMTAEQPVGSGAGSFEQRFGELMDRRVAEERERLAEQTASDDRDNLVVNGAMVGDEEWSMPDTATPGPDATSVTGHAIRIDATARFQTVRQTVPVVPGQVYSFAAQVRTDGTRASFVVRWQDARGALIRQSAIPPVNAKEWTEVRIVDDVAPLFAKGAMLMFFNHEPGVQYYSAVRMVAGSTVPPWSAAMQRSPELIKVDFARRATSTHNTYLRLAVESGIAGLLAFVGYLAALLWLAWRRENWHWMLAFVLVLVAGVAIDTLHWRQLWVFAGVLMAAGYARESAPLSPPRRPATETHVETQAKRQASISA